MMSLGSYHSRRGHPKATCPLGPCLLVLYISNNQSMEIHIHSLYNTLSVTLPTTERKNARRRRTRRVPEAEWALASGHDALQTRTRREHGNNVKTRTRSSSTEEKEEEAKGLTNR